MGGGGIDDADEDGAAAPTETTAARTPKNDTFRATERRMRTSSEGSSAQGNSASYVSSGPQGTWIRITDNMPAHD
ncbi:hypothetical protein GCM10018966_020490 [Streptomyces yanii]